MRIREAFLSCSVMAAVGVLTAPAAMATDPTPSGSCHAGQYLVEAFGPSVVACGSGTCTEIRYTVSGGKPDHVATVVASGGTDCSTSSIVSVTGGKSSGNQWYAPGVGDPVTGLGKHACHEEAAKINPDGTVTDFKVKVIGQRSPTPKTVVTKKGNSIGRCEIVGIGEEGTVAPVTETLRHENCAVEFTLDRATGTVLSAQLTADSDPDCEFLTDDVANLEIKLGTESLGLGQFGEGYIQSGNNSCTTRIIGGKVYTWGSPCP